MPIDEKILAKLRQNDPGLTGLDLSSQKLTVEDIHLLLQALVGNSALTQLNVENNRIGDEGAKALAENSTLTQLDLQWNQISAEGAKALAGNSTLTQLKLYNNQIGDEGAKALAGNSALTQLNLAYNQIGAEGAKALAGNSTLTQLNLGNNQIGDEGAKALAGNKILTQLSLWRNRIGDEGAKALAGNNTLTRLDLRSNRIGAEGAKALAGNSTLTELGLHSNLIGNEGAKALAENKTLTELNLGYNQIGDEGAKALAGNNTLTQLNLEKTELGAEGAKALAGNSTLAQLDLRQNQIDDEGAKAFLENLTLTNLVITGNKISDSLEEELTFRIKANQARAKRKAQEEVRLAHASSEKPSVEEADELPMASLSLSVNGKEEKAPEPEGVSSRLGFFPPLVDEEQVEKARVYTLAVSLQSVITDCLPVNVIISRGKYLEIQEQEEETLEELSREALRLTLVRLFGHQLSLVSENRYRIAWSSLSAGQSDQFASLYEAEYQCLLDSSETKTIAFSEAETLKTASFVDALDNDPSNKVKIAAALQTLIEERLAIEVGRRQGVSFSVRGLSEMLPEEQNKAQALRETLKVLTVGSSATFNEDSIILPWDSLRARYVRELNATFQTQLMRIERSASRGFKY